MKQLDNEPLVSIITPCHNGEKYLQECIESVLAQTYQNWEMLIIDDGSTDESATVIKSYSKKDNRVKYLETGKASGSPARPRNIGIEAAQGQYIAFLDCDDLWEPHKLMSQIGFIFEKRVPFVYSYYSRFVKLDSIGGVIKSPDTADFNSIKKRDYIPMLTILLHRDVLEGIRFVPRAKEDYVFLLDIFKKGVVAYNTKQRVALYRIAQNSRSSNKWDMFKEHYLILRDYGFSRFNSLLYTITHSLAAVLKYSK